MQSPRLLVASAALCAVAVAFAQSAPIPNAAPSPAAAMVQIPPAPTPTGAASWLIMDYSNGQVLAMATATPIISACWRIRAKTPKMMKSP